MILLTGATGLVGSHVLFDLLNLGYDVKAIRREGRMRPAMNKLFERNSSEHLLNKVQWVQADLNDPLSVEEALVGVHTVFHCAAFVSFDARDAEQVMRTNLIGTRHLVDACLSTQVHTLCYMSSTAAIGDTTFNGMRSESSDWSTDKSRSVYATSKLYAEMEVWRGGLEGLNITMVNPGIIVGPGEWGMSSTSLVATAAKGLQFYPSGTSGFVDVRDVSKGMIKAWQDQAWNERYILVSENWKFKDLFTELALALGSKPPTIAAARWLSGLGWRISRGLQMLGLPGLGITKESVRSAYQDNRFDNSKAVDQLGIDFIDLKTSIYHTAAVYKAESG